MSGELQVLSEGSAIVDLDKWRVNVGGVVSVPLDLMAPYLFFSTLAGCIGKRVASELDIKSGKVVVDVRVYGKIDLEEGEDYRELLVEVGVPKGVDVGKAREAAMKCSLLKMLSYMVRDIIVVEL